MQVVVMECWALEIYCLENRQYLGTNGTNIGVHLCGVKIWESLLKDKRRLQAITDLEMDIGITN